MDSQGGLQAILSHPTVRRIAGNSIVRELAGSFTPTRAALSAGIAAGFGSARSGEEDEAKEAAPGTGATQGAELGARLARALRNSRGTVRLEEASSTLRELTEQVARAAEASIAEEQGQQAAPAAEASATAERAMLPRWRDECRVAKRI